MLPKPVGFLLRRTWLHRLARPLCQGPVVLFYHGVVERKHDPVMQRLHMPLARFEREMRMLAKGWEVISLEELERGLAGDRGLHRRQVVLTFDDGYRNNLTVAAPLLASLGLPFTVFVSTQLVEDQARVPSYYLRAVLYRSGLRRLALPSLGRELDLLGDGATGRARQLLRRVMERSPQKTVRAVLADLAASMPRGWWEKLDAELDSEAPLTWQEVGSLKAMGATLGGHCHEHAILHDRQPAEEVAWQIGRGKELLERAAGPVRWFAYPRGLPDGIGARALAELPAQGFTLGLTTVPGECRRPPSPFLLPRFESPNRDRPEPGELSFLLSSRFRHQPAYRAHCRRLVERAAA
jgi:peptidoglycan/xylan/chitin deacetylase (PgdA/CDA1 family)